MSGGCWGQELGEGREEENGRRESRREKGKAEEDKRGGRREWEEGRRGKVGKGRKEGEDRGGGEREWTVGFMEAVWGGAGE